MNHLGNSGLNLHTVIWTFCLSLPQSPPPIKLTLSVSLLVPVILFSILTARSSSTSPKRIILKGYPRTCGVAIDEHGDKLILYFIRQGNFSKQDLFNIDVNLTGAKFESVYITDSFIDSVPLPLGTRSLH